jgi:hypothetical protein
MRAWGQAFRIPPAARGRAQASIGMSCQPIAGYEREMFSAGCTMNIGSKKLLREVASTFCGAQERSVRLFPLSNDVIWITDGHIEPSYFPVNGVRITMVDLSPELRRQARILDRLKECKTGATIESLVVSLRASLGDVRAALYDLSESKCVRFSNGMWRLNTSRR